MKPFMHKYFLSTIIIIALMSILVGCGVEELKSTWRDRKVVIDGIDHVQEWENALHYIKGKDITIGILNDEDALYIRLLTHNVAIQQQLLTAGFIIWFDGTGGNKKLYGIHFPLPTLNKDSGISDKLLQASQGDMEILQPGKNEFSTITPDSSASYGLQCHMENMGAISSINYEFL